MAERTPEPEDDPAIQRAPKVPTRWIAVFDDNPEAQRLAQLEADRDLIDRLMWGDYAGPEYALFAERLARYGLSVITAWCRTGAIFAKCAEKGWTITSQVRIPHDEAEELTNVTVAVALEKFRETVLIPKVWDPRKGASVKSFFIGQCLLRFRNEYRSRRREHRRAFPPVDDPTDVDRHAALQPGPLAAVLMNESAAALLQDASGDPLNQQILVYEAEGYTDLEIAELTGLEIPAVKSRLYRMRRTMNQRRAESA